MKRTLVLLIVFAGVIASCSSSTGVDVNDPWGRPTAGDAPNTAFYMDLTSEGESDVLLSAASDACGMVQVHETQMVDDQMSMSEVPGGIPLPEGETVALEPGGYHIMCMQVPEPITIGESVDLELTFETAGSVSVSAEIREP